MGINHDKTQQWKADTLASVDQYNNWFMAFAPEAFRKTRIETTQRVEQAILDSNDLLGLTAQLLRTHPQLLPTLRMSCCPPLAVDRLIGLANADGNLVGKMEQGTLPKKMTAETLTTHLDRVIEVVRKLIDPDIFVWISENRSPSEKERYRASTIVADRLTGARANPIIKNAQEERQLRTMAGYLAGKGYHKKPHPTTLPLTDMEPGTFCFHYPVATGKSGTRKVKVSVDALIQPKTLRPNRLPILVEAKSAGDFTNTNKRRKEEAKKMAQLQATLGSDVCYILFLCGYFDGGYLGYEASEGIDWVWEHRVEDLDQLGL